MATRAPSEASRSATARPIPREPPVTRMVFSVNSVDTVKVLSFTIRPVLCGDKERRGILTVFRSPLKSPFRRRQCSGVSPGCPGPGMQMLSCYHFPPSTQEKETTRGILPGYSFYQRDQTLSGSRARRRRDDQSGASETLIHRLQGDPGGFGGQCRRGHHAAPPS